MVGGGAWSPGEPGRERSLRSAPQPPARRAVPRVGRRRDRAARRGKGLIYAILLIAGFVGLLAMALLGFLHLPGHGHQHGHHSLDVNTHGTHVHGAHGHVEVHAHPGAAHAGHHGPVGGTHGHAEAHAGHGHAPHGHHGHEGHGDHGNGHPDQPSGGGSVFLRLLPFVSPLNWAGWAIGAGGMGLLLLSFRFGEPWLAVGAVIGAVLFQLLCMRPVVKLAMGFASQPAGNLEGCLMQHVEAVTPFNERGEGLVRVLIDGRSEDILARLSPSARQEGLKIHRGDRLLIEEVEPEQNSVRVCRG